jgi:catechol-2,3-dioxygenase
MRPKWFGGLSFGTIISHMHINQKGGNNQKNFYKTGLLVFIKVNQNNPTYPSIYLSFDFL